MKKFLPASTSLSTSKSSGFTLIEVLVVIAIIAVISTIAVALYTNVQSDARDGKRRAELESIANVLEVNRTSSGYQPITTAGFGGGTFPGKVSGRAADPSDYPYCISDADTNPADPVAVGFTSGASGVCPTSFNVIGGTVPTANRTAYKLCTRLESRGTASVLCRTNLQ